MYCLRSVFFVLLLAVLMGKRGEWLHIEPLIESKERIVLELGWQEIQMPSAIAEGICVLLK